MAISQWTYTKIFSHILPEGQLSKKTGQRGEKLFLFELSYELYGLYILKSFNNKLKLLKRKSCGVTLPSVAIHNQQHHGYQPRSIHNGIQEYVFGCFRRILALVDMK